MTYQQQYQQQRIKTALAASGAQAAQLLRQDVDANGVTNGGTHSVGYLYGMDYRDASSAYTLHIDLPGVLIGGDNMRRYIGIPCPGCPEPSKGDQINLCGASVPVMQVTSVLGIAYILTLGGD